MSTFPWKRRRWSRRWSGEDRRLLDDRHLDPPEAEQAARGVKGRNHRVEAVGFFSEQALRAPDWLGRLDLCHLPGG
jgi:hypothetical protein